MIVENDNRFKRGPHQWSALHTRAAALKYLLSNSANLMHIAPWPWPLSTTLDNYCGISHDISLEVRHFSAARSQDSDSITYRFWALYRQSLNAS